MMTNAAARAGDLLILTKPLGTGIITTGIKRGLTNTRLEKNIVRLMSKLNAVGAELAEQGLCRAATDITGFGFLGHLASMCRASGVRARIDAANIPAADPTVFHLIAKQCVPGGTWDNLKAADEIVDWGSASDADRILLCDAQTSGGLLLCISPKKLELAQAVARQHKTLSFAIVGQIEGKGRPGIRIAP